MGTVLLTGACGGMGRAICAMLLEKGYTVYGLDRKGCTPADGVRFVECDVTVPAAIDAAFARIQADAGHLDAIVHTAGIYDHDSLLEMDEVRFTRMFEVNLFGVYRVNRAFAPLFSSGGRIVFAVTKAALEKYAYSLRMEVGLLGISVSVIRPGAVKTGLLADSTRALDRFCETTQLYRCNAQRFKRIVNSVETNNVAPEAIAKTVCKALTARRPAYVYNVNRNPLLRLLNLLPDRMQVSIIRAILKP